MRQRMCVFGGFGLVMALLAGALVMATPGQAFAEHVIRGRITNSQGVGLGGVRADAVWESNHSAVLGAGVSSSNGNYEIRVDPSNSTIPHRIHVHFTAAEGSEYQSDWWGGAERIITLDHENHFFYWYDMDMNLSAYFLWDRVAPSVPGIVQFKNLTITPLPTAWQTTPLTDVYPTGSDGGVGYKESWYKKASPASGAYGAETKWTGPLTFGEGTHKITFRNVDLDNNSSAWCTPVTVSIDLTKPNTSLDSASVTTVKLKATDNLSGVKQTYRTIDGGPAALVTGGAFELPTVGVHNLTFWSVDNAGNVEAPVQARVTTVNPPVVPAPGPPVTPTPGPIVTPTPAPSPVPALPKVTLTKPNAPSTMYKGKAKTISGYLKPRHEKGTYPVRIYKYKKVGGKWVNKGYVKAKASNYSSYTKYSKAVSLPSKGSWRLRAVAPADSLHAKTYSKYDYLTVK